LNDRLPQIQSSRLKKKAREIEACLEDKLQAYQKIDASLNVNVLSADEENPLDFTESRELAREINSLLQQFTATINEMSRVVATSKSVTSSAYLQRCREILHEDRSFFRKIQSSLSKKEESAELIQNANARRTELSDTDLLLKEREHIANSSRKVDDIYNSALGTREQLQRQRRVFLRSDGRLTNMLGSLPGMSRIMDAIKKKKTRDQRVLAVVIGGCLFFTLWWVIG